MDDDDLELEASGPNRTVLIVAGVSVVALSIALVILRAARAAKPTGIAENPGIVEGDWKASLEHLAAAFDVRCQGLDARIEQLVEALVSANAGNAPAVPAAVSLPTVPIADVDADLMQPPPQPQVGALEPPPPSPAAVSM